MKELEERIAAEGRVLPGEVLKVDSSLNHQLDPVMLEHIAREFHRLFADAGITKILTVEASGIAIATMTAYVFGVPAVFAKKNRSRNLDADVYSAVVHSYTYDRDYTIMLSKRYLKASDHVLIVDDFLANGRAVEGMIQLCEQARAEVSGVGICIEKGFQLGGRLLREKGIHLESLAIIASMEDGKITFRKTE